MQLRLKLKKTENMKNYMSHLMIQKFEDVSTLRKIDKLGRGTSIVFGAFGQFWDKWVAQPNSRLTKWYKSTNHSDK